MKILTAEADLTLVAMDNGVDKAVRDYIVHVVEDNTDIHVYL